MHKQNVLLNDDEQLKPDEDISNSVTEEGKINNILDNVNNNNNNNMMGWDENNKKKIEREIRHQDLLHSSNNICLENKKRYFSNTNNYSMLYLLALVFAAMLSHYYELPKSLYHKIQMLK